MSKNHRALVGVVVGAIAGVCAVAQAIGIAVRIYPDLGSGKAFGLEGAEGMILIPICLSLVGAGAVVGGVMGALVASRWR